MGKTDKRTKAKKKHFLSFGGEYIRSPKKHRAAKLLSAMIILAVVAAAAAGALMVDHNSRSIGWGDNRTELAFAISSDRADITILGQKYFIDIDTGAVKQAEHYYSQLCRGLDYLKPAPVRLLDMLYIYLKNKISSII